VHLVEMRLVDLGPAGASRGLPSPRPSSASSARRGPVKNGEMGWRCRRALRTEATMGRRVEAYPRPDRAYLFFHPPRFPGAPPLDRGLGPNSGPDCRESVG
jgi:hypothetical protein